MGDKEIGSREQSARLKGRTGDGAIWRKLKNKSNKIYYANNKFS